MRYKQLIVLAIAVVQLVLASLIGQAEIFKLGAIAVTTLGIASAALTLVANYLPSVFGEPPTPPSGPLSSGAPKP
jgi:hypothetical protein